MKKFNSTKASFKQNSFITRYCLDVVVILALLGPLAQNGRCDFILYNDEELTVNSFHNQGTLFDTSRVFIVSGGFMGYLYAYNSSTANISGGLNYLQACDSSTANISGGSMDELAVSDFSTVNMSSGYVNYLQTYYSSTANISGGSIGDVLVAFNSSTMNISGGSMNDLWACNSSVVTFYGRDFGLGTGLTWDGNRVLGLGTLSGEWMDGTRWATNIAYNETTATIRVIPEPATLLLLGLGAVMLRRKLFK